MKTIKIQYTGHKPHVINYQDTCYTFINGDIKEVPAFMGRFLCSKYPENLESAQVKGLIFKEVK